MKCIVPAFILCFFSLVSDAQTASSKSLLWRIAGNGLQTPSYLYGTMHLKDRRLFYFGDSVYKSMEISKGFAIEIDPEEMMDSVFNKINERDTSSLLRKLLDEKKFNSVAKKLEKRFGMPADKISRQQLLKERVNWYNNVRKKDDMQTFMDMYLYNIAHKSGRYVGGIEDVSDQLNLRDELGKDVNITDYLEEDDKKRQAYLEKLIGLYTAQDIDKINELFSGPAAKENRDILLVHRNIKMARRMDSLARIRNSFFAVGAAHLPGNDGVIKLLQDKGFTVTPVFSSKKIDPEKYTYAASEIPWVKFAEPDSAYSVEMPGKASDMNYASGEVKFKVYADLVTNAFYMTGFSFHGTGESQDEAVNRMMKSFSSKGFEKLEEKNVSNKGNAGKEVIAVMGKVYYRLQFFPMTDKTFFIMTGGEIKELLYTKDADKFFGSFTMNAAVEAKAGSWVTQTDSVRAFSAVFPKKPSMDRMKAGEITNHFQTATYTALDLPNDTYYMVAVSETEKGYIISADSTIFNAKLDYYKSIKATVTDLRKFDFEGNAAMSFLVAMKQDGNDIVAKLVVISRGNRSYSLAAITKKGKEDFPDITKFFRSFKLITCKEPAWSANSFNGNSFSTWSPSAFSSLLPDTTGLQREAHKAKKAGAKKMLQFIAHDPYSALSYNVNVYPAPKYYCAKTDSAFITSLLKDYYTDSSDYFARSHPGKYDSLVYCKAVTNGNVKGYEILVKNAAKNYFNRIRILPHGDSSYHLVVMAGFDVLTSRQVNRFFEDFRFKDENMPSSVAQNKTALILKDLSDADSLTAVNAKDALSANLFDHEDLPLLFKGYLSSYPADTTSTQTINESIGYAINKIHDSAIITFVNEKYSSAIAASLNLKNDMLYMLAKQQTVAAVNTLKELLLKDPPQTANSNQFIPELKDSVELAKSLFPEASQLFGDSISGPGIIMLADRLVDSNLLQRNMITDNQAGILVTAKRQLKQIKTEHYAVYSSSTISLLGKLNNLQAVEILNGFVKLPNPYAKQAAILALLKINRPVNAAEIYSVAANPSYRISFYTALKKAGRENLFPPEFLTQQKFAESYLQENVAEEDYDDIQCTFLIQKTAAIKGRQQKYYLFKVTFDDGEGKKTHLGICGPFDTNPADILVKDDSLRTIVYSDEKYMPINTDKLFNKFVKDENGEVKAPGEK